MAPASQSRRRQARSRPLPHVQRRAPARHEARNELFFESILHEDRSILEFIDSDYTFLTGRLAKFYGISGVGGSEFPARRTSPALSHRGGVLTQASILTVSSYPTARRRCFAASGFSKIFSTLRRLRRRPTSPISTRAPSARRPAFASSSSSTAAIRFAPPVTRAWIRWDSAWKITTPSAAGAPKTASFTIDADGRLPGGRTFDGPEGLKQILLGDKRAFTECLAEKLLTYALGRGLEDYDQPAVQSIVTRTASAGYKFSSSDRRDRAQPIRSACVGAKRRRSRWQPFNHDPDEQTSFAPHAASWAGSRHRASDAGRHVARVRRHHANRRASACVSRSSTSPTAS